MKRHIEGVHNQKEDISKSEDEALQISEENSRSSSLGHVETDLKPIETSVIKKREIKNESSPKKIQNSTINQSPSSSTAPSTSCSSSHNVVELSDEEQMRNHDEERISSSPNQMTHSHLNHTERPHSYTCDRCLLR